jgi:type II secretory pathway predicted ATPase ExeA
MAQATSAVPIEALATLRPRLAALSPRHPERRRLMESTAQLYAISRATLYRLLRDNRRPKMEEIGDRATVFEFGGLRDQQRNYIDWVLRASLTDAAEPEEILTAEAATSLAAKLKTPLQISQHLVRAFEAGFEVGVKPIDARPHRRGRSVPPDQRSRSATDAQRL